MRAILITLFLTANIVGFSQTREYKNAIYGTFGTIPATVGTANIKIERYLFDANLFVPGSVSLRLSYGTWGTWTSTGSTYIGTLNFISGHGKKHFEIGFGPALIYEKDEDFIEVELPDGTTNFQLVESTSRANTMGIYAGYRYTSKFFVFRAGAGWPETIYIGLGVAF